VFSPYVAQSWSIRSAFIRAISGRKGVAVALAFAIMAILALVAILAIPSAFGNVTKTLL